MNSKSFSSVFKQTLAAFLAFCGLFSATPAFAQDSATASGIKVEQTGFSDLPRTSPYYTSATYLNQAGVIGGYPDGTFKPDNTINRAEVLKIILKGSGTATDDAAPESAFSDVKKEDWFSAFVMKAKALGIANGNPDGTFAPGRTVNKAEFLKMLLLANKVNMDSLKGKDGGASDVAATAWYASYVNYALNLGLITLNAQGKAEPEKALSRGEVTEVMYLMAILRKGNDTQFLLARAEAELAQIEVYIAANRVDLAKKSSDLAVDFTQQAYKNMADNNVVVGAAKLARAYNMLVTSFILGIQKKNTEAADMANQAIDKAGEAWEANNATQPIAKHIKDRAREILTQVGGTEN